MMQDFLAAGDMEDVRPFLFQIIGLIYTLLIEKTNTVQLFSPYVCFLYLSEFDASEEHSGSVLSVLFVCFLF